MSDNPTDHAERVPKPKEAPKKKALETQEAQTKAEKEALKAQLIEKMEQERDAELKKIAEDSSLRYSQGVLEGRLKACREKWARSIEAVRNPKPEEMTLDRIKEQWKKELESIEKWDISSWPRDAVRVERAKKKKACDEKYKAKIEKLGGTVD